jgi:two-component sensor histidine kinase
MKYVCIRTHFYLLVFFFNNLFAQQVLQIEIDGISVDEKKEVNLLAGYHEIVFNFPENIKSRTSYKFKINEFESTWRQTPYPTARYTNLPGGKYKFQLQYLDANNQAITLSKSFDIKENFWEKWWFYLFLFIATCAILFILVYFWTLYDQRQKKRTQLIRKKIAADLHDEVGANLSSISFLVESLKKSLNGQQEKFDPILNRISSNSLETAGLINDTIWALNPDYDNFDKLLERIENFGFSILSAKDIAFEVENTIAGTSIDLSVEQRRNLFLIMKEAINNIAKHSKASKAKLSIELLDNKLNIRINDNGKGIINLGNKEGNGLDNYKLRSSENNILVQVSSESGEGTLIEIAAMI